eukprot:2519177-Pyramimonas_sp.AAC.1
MHAICFNGRRKRCARRLRMTGAPVSRRVVVAHAQGWYRGTVPEWSGIEAPFVETSVGLARA